MERQRGTDPNPKPERIQGEIQTTPDISRQPQIPPRPVRVRPPFVRLPRQSTPIEGPKPGGQP